ncbi:MAG: sulfotransferase [Cyanobacteria bacterium P01_H01_bin.105]
MKLPNFLIVGAAKAGTTSLCYYLDQHPQVYISPIKEPRFFAPEFYTAHTNGPIRDNARRTIFTSDEYYQLFEGVSTETAIGEASTEYLYYPEVPSRIQAKVPDAKIIAVLRNPVERAFSAFCYQVRDACESVSFEEALQEENDRICNHWRPGWLYKDCGFYYSQVKRYFDIFNHNRIKIYLYDELDKDSYAVVKDAFEFLQVDSDFVPEVSRKNVSKVPKSRLLNTFLTRESPLKKTLKAVLPDNFTTSIAKCVRGLNYSQKPILTSETRQSLIDLYRDDILRLETLIQKDLSAWLD